MFKCSMHEHEHEHNCVFANCHMHASDCLSCCTARQAVSNDPRPKKVKDVALRLQSAFISSIRIRWWW